MKKKWWIGLLSLACLAVGGLGLVACGDNSAQKGDEPTQIQVVYAQYVAHAEEKGEEPLSYEEWLASIKGEKGDKGDQGEKGVGIKTVEFDEDGNLLITFTDGTMQTVEMPKKDGVTQTVESLQYQRISGKDEYRVIGLGNVSELDIVIPDTYKGLPVTEIGKLAFGDTVDARARYIERVVIGDSVTSIGSSAFNGCSSLTEIVIPDSVTSIGDLAFYQCSSLTEIVIPDGVTTIGYAAFFNCTSLKEIVIPDSVTSIGESAFEYCTSLTEIVLPDSVTSIGESAFRGCTSLTEIVIGDSVTSIGKRAFSDCTSLTEIVIPDSVTTIGYAAFDKCSSLTEIVIPDSVTSIGDWAFDKCTSLTIYCEAENQPSGWDADWNGSDCPVVWGYKGE